MPFNSLDEKEKAESIVFWHEDGVNLPLPPPKGGTPVYQTKWIVFQDFLLEQYGLVSEFAASISRTSDEHVLVMWTYKKIRVSPSTNPAKMI